MASILSLRVTTDLWNTCSLTCCAHSPCRQCGGPVPFINRMTLSKSAILHRFPNFYTLGGRHFPEFLFPFKSTYDPYEPWKVPWKSDGTFFRNPEHRHTDGQTRQLGQTDAATLYIYIYIYIYLYVYVYIYIYIYIDVRCFLTAKYSVD